MKTFLTYALLVATWIFFLVIIVYLWVAKELTPPFWSFIILLAVAALPLASRLKIGNWFDFTKDMHQLKQDVEGNKESIKQFGSQLALMSTQLQSVMLMKQVQQQNVFNLPNSERVKAFAQSLAVSTEFPYSLEPSKMGKKEDQEVSDFLQNADHLIASSMLVVYPLYVWIISWRDGSDSVLEDIRPCQLKLCVKELKQIYQTPYPDFPTVMKNEMIEHLNALETILNLRDSVFKRKLKPPPPKEAQEIFGKAWRAIMLIDGIISGRLAASECLVSPCKPPPKSTS
jgi:hypothetical protein